MDRQGAAATALALTLAVGVLGVSLGMAGCGGGDASSSPRAEATGSSRNQTTIAGKTEPEVRLPDIPPPRKLIVKTLEAGHGPRAVVGDRVKVEYKGINWAGEPYSNSWTYSGPPVFALGVRAERRLEYGLDLAVRGMRPGGRREVIIPPRLIYWPDKPGTQLTRIDTLVFVIDLLQITKRGSGQGA